MEIKSRQNQIGRSSFILQGSAKLWLPFDRIYEDGIIKLKNNFYVKILKVNPINFSLKSEFEKISILNSYKLFLKTCNFDIQILIQSNKEDIERYTKFIKENQINESEKLKKISERYCEELNKINNENIYSSKNFFIILKKYEVEENINLIKDELNNNYFKVKECLTRCGNNVIAIENKNEVVNILYTFFNKNKNV